MNIIKVINHQKPYIGRDGNPHPSVNFYVEVEMNGNPCRVAIRPSFPKGAYILDLVAEKSVIKAVDSSNVGD